MSFIDVHCHLDGGEYGDLDELFKKILGAGVEKLIAVGYDYNSSLFCLRLSEKYPFIYFAAGIHPTECAKAQKGDIAGIERLLTHPKCVALGEIGLDYHYPNTDKELQKEYFLRQLEVAAGLNLPVQIHSRDCAEDMLSLLSAEKNLLKNGFLMHCYSHSTELSAEFLKLGAYFSFGGASTWRGAKKARRTICALPQDRLLTETDSPYMPPESLYGTFPNTPASIPEILSKMAEARGEDIGELSRRVIQNAHTLFTKLKNQSLPQ